MIGFADVGIAYADVEGVYFCFMRILLMLSYA